MKMKKTYVDVMIILAVAGFIMFFKLGAVPLLDPDEPVYMQTAMEMLANHDFISPRIYGDFWYDKPPMYYWLVAAMVKVFGVSEFAARLPSAILAIAGALGVYFYGRSLLDRRSALYGALVLVTSFEYFYLGKAAVTDITLMFFFSGAVFAYLKQQYSWLYACMGCAVLTKGPVGIVLPLAIIFLHLLLSKNLKEILQMKLLRGAMIFLAIATPWYILMYNIHGREFIETFLGFHNVTRFLEPEHSSGQIWYYYVPVLLVGFFPWTAYVFQALREGWKNRKGECGKVIKCLMIWLSVVFVFFSISQTKLISYILPMYPPLALLTGWYIERCVLDLRTRQFNLAGIAMAIFSLCIIIALEVTAEKKLGVQVEGIWYLGIVLFMMNGLNFLGNLCKNKRYSLAGTVIGMMCFVVILMQHILPVAAEFVSVKSTAVVFRQVYTDKTVPVYVEKFYRPGFCFYTGIAGKELNEDIQTVLKDNNQAYLLVREDTFENLSKTEKARLTILNKQDKLLLICKV